MGYEGIQRDKDKEGCRKGIIGGATKRGDESRCGSMFLSSTNTGST